MLQFEFIVEGPPLSHQTKDRGRLRDWEMTVRAAAEQYWTEGRPPFAVPLQITVVYYHDGLTANMDNDNMVKPIQDALNGLVYIDDKQITDTRIRKTDVNGSFRMRGISRILAEGFCRGSEFLYVKVQAVPNHEELLQ